MNIQQKIAKETGTKVTDWEPIDGPDSGTGCDYYFRHKETREEIYVNDDQGYVTISYPDAQETFFNP